ncbi:MAG: UMP kinase [Promethearchaeota archaeon]
MALEKIILKIGGSLLFGNDLNVNTDRVKEFIEFIKTHASQIDCVVIGGGRVARVYIGALGAMNPNQARQDMLGIRVSKLNAILLAGIIGDDIAYQGVPGSIEELLAIKSMVPSKIVVLGGLEVGQSTTSVACEVAESLGGRMLIIGTDVDGIYTKDPDKHPDAKKLEEVTLDELVDILGLVDASNQKAGEYRILDFISMSIIRRSNLRVRILKGDVDSLGKALDGVNVGTLIKPR